MNFKECLKQQRLYLDGGMGSIIQQRVADIPTIPETLNLTHPEIIGEIQEEYVAAGSNILVTNTFGANRYKLRGRNLSVETLVKAAVDIARAQNPDFVALDIGPIGALIGALGDVPFEEAVDIFKETITAGADAGVDLIIIETMTDIYEARAAVLAAKESCALPIIASMTYEENGRTLTGSDPLTVVTILEALGVDAIGINCSTGPDRMLPIIKALLDATQLPLVVQPNAGLPRMVAGETHYDITSDEFAGIMARIAKAGGAILGGCCGTTPEYIKKTIEATAAIPLVPPKGKPQTRVATATGTLVLGEDIRVIGECINPSASAELKEDLRAGGLSVVKKLALAQVHQGAHILDLNMGLPEIDEVAMMAEAVEAVSQIVDVPLQIDSTDPEVLEAALRRCNGKPIINSVNGEDASLAAILPLAKKYGACVLGLTLDDGGLPETADQRIAIAEKIITAAQAVGIPQSDILIDCLCLTASAQQDRVRSTLDAVSAVGSRFGVPTVLGVSNISFGLPNRELINKTFLVMAMEAGLNTPILNPGDAGMMDAIAATRALNGLDENCFEFIRGSQNRKTEPKSALPETEQPDLTTIVVEGRQDEAATATRRLLEELEPMVVVNDHLIPGLDQVGKAFETGEAFLPNLIFAAETVQNAFTVIKEQLGQEGQVVKGTILLATVKGDVHDIGKNILKVILENYGYQVVDLGKDVEAQTIAAAVAQDDIRLVGLSALMTTTVKNMETTIALLRTQCPQVKVMVGGAVLNPEYAQAIGADYYGKDARAGVEIARVVFGE